MSDEKTSAGWHDYGDLPKRLQLQARTRWPRFTVADLSCYQFCITADGDISRAPGIGSRKFTAAYCKDVKAFFELMEAPARPEKGDIHHLRTARFSLGSRDD